MTNLVCGVVGAGAAGSAAALSLARRGASVRLFDQFAFGHDKGSSHGPTRLLRLAYFEHPDYVPLLRRALALWRQLEKESGERLFEQTGVLEAGPPGGFLVGGVRRAAAMHDLDIENLSGAAFAERFRWMRLPAGDEALFEAEAGFVHAGRTVRTQIAQAKARGAALHSDDAVRGWQIKPSGIELDCASGKCLVDRLVVAAGVWAPRLLGSNVAPVSIKEKALFWVGDDQLSTRSGFAPFAFEAPGKRVFYGFPAIDGDGVKVAEHTGGAPRARPEDRTGKAAPEEREAVLGFLRHFAPGLPRQIKREETCLYELSPDENFMIGRHPEDQRVCFAAGLSGHGFKFAPLIGEALADLAMDRDLSPEFRFLDPARLKAGSRPSS